MRPHHQPSLLEIMAAENLSDVIEDVQSYAQARTTREQYAYRCRAFDRYGEAVGQPTFPASPETVLRFLAIQSQRVNPQCVKLFRAAIKSRHVMAEFPDPTATASIDKFIFGNTRKNGKPKKKKKALRVEELRRICLNYDREGGIVAIRDKALMLTGFCGCFRSSEVSNIMIEHIEFTTEGLSITVPKSKTDQKAEGQSVGIPHGKNPETDPVLAVKEWLEERAAYCRVESIETGPLFPAMRLLPSGRQRIYPTSIGHTRYSEVIKRAVAQIGLDPALYAGHSGRSGHATSAARAGANREDIKKQGRWRSDEVVGGYIQEGNLFKDNSCHKLDL